MILRPFRTDSDRRARLGLPWLPRRARVRGTLHAETQEVVVADGAIEEAMARGELPGYAAGLYRDCLGRSPRFARALEDGVEDVIVETLTEGLSRLAREEGSLTICPLLTEGLRGEPPEAAGAARLELRLCVLIVTFRTSPARDPVNPDAEVCRAYYERILLPFVRRRLERALDGRRFRRRTEIESFALDALVRTFAELRNRFPLRAEEWIDAPAGAPGEDPRCALRSARRAMLRAARERLGEN